MLDVADVPKMLDLALETLDGLVETVGLKLILCVLSLYFIILSFNGFLEVADLGLVEIFRVVLILFEVLNLSYEAFLVLHLNRL